VATPAIGPHEDRDVIARDVVVSEWGDHGPGRQLRVGTLRKVRGRIEFLRLPLLSGFELQDVEMVEGGVSTFEAESIRVIPALRTTLIRPPSTSGVESRERAKQLAQFLSALLPKP